MMALQEEEGESAIGSEATTMTAVAIGRESTRELKLPADGASCGVEERAR